MSRLKTAFFHSAVSQQASLILSFITIIITARLLTPGELGVYGVASSIALLAIELRAFGVAQYLIRERDLDNDKVSSAFCVNILMCISLGALLILLSYPLSVFFFEPDLIHLILIFSLTFFIAPLSTIPWALMARKLEFGKLAIINLSTSLIRAILTIIFVLLGLSYYSMALALLASAIADVVLVRMLHKSIFAIRPSTHHWRQIVTFGLFSSWNGVMQRTGTNLPDYVIGRMFDMQSVAAFSKGLGALLFIDKLLSMAVRPLVLPHLSEIKRQGGDLGLPYLNCVVITGAIAIPAFVMVGVTAETLILILFGAQWESSAPIASILTFWAIFRSAHTYLPNALYAIHCERSVFFKETITFIVYLFCVIVGARIGLKEIAWGLVVASIFEFTYSCVLAKKKFNLQYKIFAFTYGKNIALGVTTWLAAYSTMEFLSGYSNIYIKLTAVATTTFIAWLIALKALDHILIRIIRNIAPGWIKAIV